jgi:uracil permease
MAVLSATVLVPILVGIPTNNALFSAGLATLFFIWVTKKKVFTFLGSSFAFIGTFILVKEALGIEYAYGGAIASGVFYCLVALIVKFAGSNWFERVFPPVVIGSVIICIGLSLAPTAISSMGLLTGTGYSLQSAAIAGLAIVFVMLASVVFRKQLGSIAVLIGLFVTYAVVALLGTFIPFFNVVDMTAMKEAEWLYMPVLVAPKFAFTSIIAFVIVSLSTICEHTGDMITVGSVLRRDVLKDPGLHRTLIGDGVGNIIAGLTGSVVNTSYGEATATMIVTRVASIWVAGGAAVLAILLSLFGKFGGFLATIPGPIIGGVSCILYGLIAAAGLRVLVEKQVDFKNTRNLIISAVILSFGLGGAVLTFTAGGEIIRLSSIALAALVGIVLNLVLPQTN